MELKRFKKEIKDLQDERLGGMRKSLSKGFTPVRQRLVLGLPYSPKKD